MLAERRRSRTHEAEIAMKTAAPKTNRRLIAIIASIIASLATV